MSCQLPKTSIFYCYTRDYSQGESDITGEPRSNGCLILPAVSCMIESCIEGLEGKTHSDNCQFCNNITDPICHDCSLFFCPIGLVFDILTMPLRCCYYKQYTNKKVYVEEIYTIPPLRTEKN